MLAQLKLYVTIGISVVIIGLLIWLGIERGRVAALKTKVDNLEHDGKIKDAEIEIKENTIKVKEDMTAAEIEVRFITNETALDIQTQIAVNKIIEGYYK